MCQPAVDIKLELKKFENATIVALTLTMHYSNHPRTRAAYPAH
jgi:hypothetical protein